MSEQERIRELEAKIAMLEKEVRDLQNENDNLCECEDIESLTHYEFSDVDELWEAYDSAREAKSTQLKKLEEFVESLGINLHYAYNYPALAAKEVGLCVT